MNSVCLSGNIGREPELRSTQSGTSILSFSLAVNERIKKGDEWIDYTNWVDVCVFGRRAESLSKILTKGMKTALTGRLRYSAWERDGQKRSKLEVIAEDIDIMQRRDGSRSQQDAAYGPQVGQQANYPQQQQYGQQGGFQGGYGQYQQQGYGQGEWV